MTQDRREAAERLLADLRISFGMTRAERLPVIEAAFREREIAALREAEQLLVHRRNSETCLSCQSEQEIRALIEERRKAK